MHFITEHTTEWGQAGQGGLTIWMQNTDAINVACFNKKKDILLVYLFSNRCHAAGFIFMKINLHRLEAFLNTPLNNYHCWKDGLVVKLGSILQKDADSFEIGATCPEKTEKGLKGKKHTTTRMYWTNKLSGWW